VTSSSSSRPPAVSVRGLVREFKGGNRAIDGLDIEVPQGEIYGFLGPNGAGKTTTVRILVTLLRPTAGEARVAGFDVVADPDAVRRNIGVALQEAAIDPLMTGRELLRMQGALHGMRGVEARSRTTELLERVGLTDAGGRRVGEYSGGMRRRLDLAMALVHRPKVLFLDEPTTGLDPTSRSALWREVRGLNDDGTTVFLTTQYLEEAEQLADRVGIIAGGSLAAEGTPEELKARVGEPTLHVELGEGADVPAARRAVSAVGPLVDCGEDDARVAIRAAAGKATVPLAIRALDEAGIAVESVEVQSPTLDDVFAAVTGSTLEGASQSRGRAASAEVSA
jgi:ABC-2 type transport system ATP-binding protein